MENLKARWAALPQWQKYVILLLLPIAIIVYVYLMLITPLKEELEKNRRERDQLISQIEELKRSTDLRVLDSLKKQKAELETQLIQKNQELERVVGEIPSKKDVSTVYRRLGLIARKSGVVILSVTLGKPAEVGYDIEKTDKEKGMVKIVKTQEQAQQQPDTPTQTQQATPPAVVKYPTAELKLSFAGKYSQINNFLRGLEKEGLVSYPSSLKIDKFEGDRLRGEISLFVLMKEEKP
ncbi:hypothetical protein [Thermocrinis sp.]